jgi:hypothetical protein
MGRTGVLITIEYFTAPVPQQEYDAIKQDLLFCAKEQMEALGLRMASSVAESAVG